jgi:spore germination protein GerM
MNSEVTPNQPENSPPPPSRKSWGWLLLLPIAALLFMLWNNNRPQPTPPQAGPTTTSTQSADATPTTGTQSGGPFKITIFVPDDNAELQKREIVVPDMDENTLPTAPDKHFEEVSTRALELLLQKAPETFPTGTRLSKPVTLQDGIARVDLNAAFQQPEFWQKGDTYALLATNAIVNTVASANMQPDQAIKVRFLVEGKPLHILGQLDFSDPVEPDPKLVATR